ncbi:hypothetical protein RRG08_010300 [Elysia crispata]|uniref:Uncharacterized protein n=1 Tax=Elysia crispata TaxID=231223 RepID=A0AAE0Z3R0_9GAST|nr:hypothetical protein RRG08_010300 [Elysia crispata]
MQVTWGIILNILNLGIVLAYGDADLSQTRVSDFVQILICICAFIWMIFDVGWLDLFARYAFSPYILFSTVYIGIMSNGHENNDVLSTALLGICGGLLCFKFLITIFRHVKRGPV